MRDRRTAAADALRERKARDEAREEIRTLEEAQSFLQEVSQAFQQQANERLASVVSRCLEAVWGVDAPEFRIMFDRKRGKTEARLLFVKNDREMDPILEEPGGQVDVAAFALRVACLKLHQPPLRQVLFLDEPFKFVNGEDAQERVAKMLNGIAREMGIQIVMVTDDDWLQLGKVELV